MNDSKQLSIALTESAENVSAKEWPEKVARLYRALVNSSRGMQCTQKLHVDFYTHKIVFENISQNERLPQSQHPRNIASNYLCTTQIQLRLMKLGIFTWVCTVYKQPYDPDASVTATVVCARQTG